MNSDWPSAKLKDVCSYISRGISPSYVDIGGACVLNQKCIRGGEIILGPSRRTDPVKKRIPAEKRLLPLDILVNSTGQGTLGRVAQAGNIREIITVDSHITLVRPNSALIDPSYLGYVVKSMQARIEGLAEGSTGQTELSREKLGQLDLKLPDRGAQEKISELLRNLDSRIRLLRETSATLEAIAQALFKSWFVDFDPVCAKIAGLAPEGMDEATASLFPDGFAEAELGYLPRGWERSSLAEVCSYLNRGLSPKYLEEGGVLVLNQKCVRDFSVDYTKGRRHDSAQRKINGRALVVGDVLVNSTGVGTLGRVAQVLELPEPAIVDSHVTVVRAGSRLSWPYLGQWLAKLQPEIEAMGEGSTGQTELSRTKLGAMMILVPPRDVLTAFDAIVEPLKARVALNDAGANDLTAIRDRLLPRLISGQVNI